jgi:hypothetical protein
MAMTKSSSICCWWKQTSTCLPGTSGLHYFLQFPKGSKKVWSFFLLFISLVIDILLDRQDIDINVQTPGGTALMMAGKRGNLKTVQAVLNHPLI